MIIELKDQVKRILEKYPDARNSDVLLNIIRMSEFEDVHFTKEQLYVIKNFLRNYDSTSRARRLVQAEFEELRPTDPKIRAKRRKMEVEVKKELGYPDQAFRMDEAEMNKQAKMFEVRYD